MGDNEVETLSLKACASRSFFVNSVLSFCYDRNTLKVGILDKSFEGGTIMVSHDISNVPNIPSEEEVLKNSTPPCTQQQISEQTQLLQQQQQSSMRLSGHRKMLQQQVHQQVFYDKDGTPFKPEDGDRAFAPGLQK
jgi:Fe-S cluster biosynthesis and repair protein YggX